MAPAHLQGSPAFYLERDTLRAELACIRRDVPPAVMAATTCPAVASGDTVVLTTGDTVDYVDVTEAEGSFTYHELFLDTHGRPHRTGNSLHQLPDDVVITHVELWDESPEHKEPGEELAAESESDDDDEPGDPFPDPLPAIMVPTTTTFPRNDGWLLPGQEASDQKRKLSDLTIYTVTAHLTSIVTKDKVVPAASKTGNAT